MRWIVAGTAAPPEQASETITPDKWAQAQAPVLRAGRNAAFLAAAGLLFVPVPIAAAETMETVHSETVAVFAAPHFIVKGTCEPIVFEAPAAEDVTLDKWWAGDLRAFLRPARPKSLDYEAPYVPEVPVVPMEAIGGEVSAVFSSGHWIVAGTSQPISQEAGVAETVTLDKWKHADLRIPRAVKLYPHGEECPVFTEYLSSDAILDASRVVRRPYLTRANYSIDPRAITDGETVTLDKWGAVYAPEIRRRPRPGKASYDLTLATFAESVSLDRWSVEVVKPTLRKGSVRPAPDFIFAESQFITLDKWTGPAAEIRRRPKGGRASYDLTQVSFAEAVSLDRWIGPSIEIRRQKLRGRAFYELERGGASAEIVTFDKWEDRAALRPRSKRLFFYPPSVLVQSTFAESVSLDRWVSPDPKRSVARVGRRDLSQFVSLVQEALTLDKWETRNGILIPARRRQRPEFAIDLSPRAEFVSIDRFEGTSSRLARPKVQPVRSWITASTLAPGLVPDVAFDPPLGHLIRAILPILRDRSTIDPSALTLAENILLQWLPSHTHIPRGPKQPTRRWTTEDTELFRQIIIEGPFVPMFFLDGEGRVTAVIDGTGRIIGTIDGVSYVSPVIEES